jgi:hypothetical protein
VKVTARPSNIQVRADDESLTGHAGLLLVSELVGRMGVVPDLDAAIEGVRPFKRRRRGLTGGELLMSVAEMIMTGGDHLVHLDALRQDKPGAKVRSVARVPAPTTAGELLPSFTERQCRAVVEAMAEIGNRFDRQMGFPVEGPVTLDLDPTDTEVYGKRKKGASFNSNGVLSYATHTASWSERRRLLAVDLASGSESAKPRGPKLLRRAVAVLPESHGPVRARMDSEFYTGEMMETARQLGVGFSISVPRNHGMWEARRHTGPRSWKPALDMEGAEVAETTYRPTGWKHEPLRLIIRRVRVEADEISQDSRSRRRRTMPKGQLQLALKGYIDHTYSYSFIITDQIGNAAEIELWHRQRARIEERFKDLKLGCGMEHAPMGSFEGNRAWQTATVIATNLISMLSAAAAKVNHERLMMLVANAQEPGPRRAPIRVARHNAEFVRRWLINVPGRILRGGRQLHLRLAQGMLWAETFIATYQRLRLLTSTA